MYSDEPTHVDYTPTYYTPARPASAQGFTPAYLWKDFEPPARLQRERTTYGHMNDWMKMNRGNVPLTMSDNNWHNLKQTEKLDHDLQFKKSYNNLTSKIAYRYPNPGKPRQRQGRIGGSWRHIKEVLGHGGSRVVYVDGLISVYDSENFNQALNSQVPMMPHIKSKVMPDSDESAGAPVQFPPVSNNAPSYTDGDVARKMGLNVSPKYKGFYRYGN
ncbi:hypothetical protein FSP39_001148 [Pinctada imbricata]|uniref:Uncharacterized protein n=1 Tax=Pinctada imbricata TaxID=66713 RepID=A0AA88YGS1_PINIB|nr:hypothetical protein FSP39_001148 [Pinctada imbricata]